MAHIRNPAPFDSGCRQLYTTYYIHCSPDCRELRLCRHEARRSRAAAAASQEGNFTTSYRKPSCPQDINMSLYFVTVNQKSRSQRSLGQRVPRYQKLVQVRFPSGTVSPLSALLPKYPAELDSRQVCACIMTCSPARRLPENCLTCNHSKGISECLALGRARCCSWVC